MYSFGYVAMNDPIVFFQLAVLFATFLYLVKITFFEQNSSEIFKDACLSAKEKAISLFEVGSLISLPKTALRRQRV